jgi:DNA-binding MarR family transcriptional regulator
MSNLFVIESANATYLLRQTDLTWGNLGSHLAKLENAGYVAVAKGYNGKKPETTISLTDEGRRALIAYRDQLLQALSPMIEESHIPQ